MFSMHLVFYKISLGHFQTRSKSLSRALLQFEHTNAQHTGIWWLPRPTFCQAAPFVIIPHWRCYCSHSLEWSCDRLEISVHTNCQSSHLYFSHFVSHSLEWSFDISDELEHLKPSFEIIQLWWRYCSLIRSVHLKHSTHTKCQQVALSYIPSTGRTQFTFWLPRRTWNFNLKSFSYFSHYVLHSLEWSFGNLNAYKLPKLAPFCFSHYLWSDHLEISKHTNS